MRAAIGSLCLLVAMLVPQSAPAAMRVLFVGNSLTYYNDLPATFATVYAATVPGAAVETEMLAQPGGRLRERLDDGQLAALLARQHYDVVVLQELGGFPDCPREFPGCEDAPAALREAVALVRAHGARALWFSTWQADPAAQASLSARSATLARALALDIVDIGAAVHRVPAATRRRLLDATGHPTPAATWLAAATLVQALSARPLPETAPPASCGHDWRIGLKGNAPASAQRHGEPRCHGLSNAQWRRLRAAARP